MPQTRLALSLFWRTLFLLLALLALGAPGWVQTLRAFDAQTRAATQAAEQLAGLLKVSAEALRVTDRAARPVLMHALAARAGLMLQPHVNSDAWSGVDADPYLRQVAVELRARLGDELPVAGSLNGQPALWLGLKVDRDAWWLGVPAAMQQRPASAAWLAWGGASLALTLLGSVLIARRINRPLRQLSFAASRIRGGEFDSRLDETTVTHEIREVNMGFNRMARELAKVDEDRAVMLAGISHDLRTPLARLRLEAEMSVFDDEARANIAQDIDQLDAIIDKFMDYARPGETHMRPIALAALIAREAAAFREPGEIRISSRVGDEIEVLADEVELARVLANLFENARRYGRSTDTGIAVVTVSCARAGAWVICSVRDQGPGVAPEKLGQLTTPFFRGDAARTAATGAGLGLAIVEKAMQRMGGQVEIANAADGGLVVHLRLQAAAVPAER